MAPNTLPPEFCEGSVVVCIFPKSKYYGVKGTVYGSEISARDKKLRVFVQWPDGNRLQYRLDNLAPAPKAESEYKISRKNNGHGRFTSVHVIPAESRARPNIFEQLRRSKQ